MIQLPARFRGASSFVVSGVEEEERPINYYVILHDVVRVIGRDDLHFFWSRPLARTRTRTLTSSSYTRCRTDGAIFIGSDRDGRSYAISVTDERTVVVVGFRAVRSLQWLNFFFAD